MRNPVWQRTLVALAALAVLLFAGPVAAETRVALIIANSNYGAFGTLRNPGPDARLVADALHKSGFDKVTVVEDLGRAAMIHALQEFGNEADHADVALVYYAGHGVEVDHVNYIVPVDVTFAHERDVDNEAIKLDNMLAYAENAKRLRIVILDACRDSPYFKQGRQAIAQPGATSKGLAAVEPNKNTIVIYSAKAGTVAYDGGVNSPFAQALARRIVDPQQPEISLLVRQVRDDVMAQTSDKQEPVAYNSLSSQEFFFIQPTAMNRASALSDIEREAWGLCKNAQSRVPCDAYLKSYPTGLFASLAQTRVADIAHPGGSAVVAAARSTSASGPAAAPLRIGDLGIVVRFDTAAKGIVVNSVERNAVAAGTLFDGDVITKIAGDAPDPAQPADAQLIAAWKADGRIPLVVRRGGAPSAFVLKKPIN